MQTKYSKLILVLTKRELQIANHLVGFDSYKTIGELLCISASTCRKHASNIFEKVKVKNRIEFRKKYTQISQFLKLSEGYPEKITQNKSILTWSDNNSFEQYYIEFSRVMKAMLEGNFKLRLTESDDPDDIESFIAKGINKVNEELDNEYLDSKTLISILSAYRLNNRILILSKNGKTVNHIFLLSEDVIIRPESIKGKSISELFINYKNEDKLKVTLNPHIFLSNHQRFAYLEVTKTTELTILTATIVPEEKIEKLLPRILGLISTMAEQQADSPKVYNSVIESAISIEANELYNELKDYMLSNKLGLS